MYPFEKRLCYNLKPESVLFADVGGGMGQLCVAFRQRLGRVHGRIVNQDLLPVIA